MTRLSNVTHTSLCAVRSESSLINSSNVRSKTSFFTVRKWHFDECFVCSFLENMDRVKRIWYLSPMRAAKVQASLRICAVSPGPSLLAHTSSESRGTVRQKARSLAPLNGWACAVKICHDGMLEDTNSLDGAHMLIFIKLMSHSMAKPTN